MEIVYMIILALAGLGILLYGMLLFSSALETSLGSRFNKKFSKVASNPFKSYLVGSGITFLTQKVTLTCGMIMGFVDVGTITPKQSIAFVLGISFGSALSMIVMMFQGLNLTIVLSILCFVGALITLFFKTNKMQQIGQALVGFGMLFLGIELVGTYATEIFAIPAVFDFLSSISNPFVVILIGFLVSFLTTSTFASLTIITALVGVAGSGPISIETAFLGMLAVAVGTALSDYVYTIAGQSVEAKRVTAFHVLFRLFTFLICLPFYFTPLVSMLYNSLEQNAVMTLIIIHMVQMTIPSLILLPFGQGLSKMMEKLVRPKKENDSVYADFILPDNVISVFGVGYPSLLKSTRKLLELSEQLQKDLIVRITEKRDIRGLSGRIKGLEKVIKVTSNTAIRMSAKAGENELPKLNVLLNIINDIIYLNERSKKLYNYGSDLLKKTKPLVDSQNKALVKVQDELMQFNELVYGLIDTLLNGQNIENKTVKLVMERNKKVFALCQKFKKTTYSDYVKSKRYPENDLFFSIILVFEDVNTDLANIAIKLGILSA